MCAVVGDGEAETGPLATSWHSNKFLNPARDGAVLPILHLNGYKIANPTVLARIPREELAALMEGYGHTPYFVEGDDPESVHQQLAATLDTVVDEIREIQRRAREEGVTERPRWPMIVLQTPKGWTGPKEIDGHKVEGTWRSHQVPMGEVRTNAENRAILERWMRSYRPEELFDDGGHLRPELAALPPAGTRRMSANPVANGGELLRELVLPDFRDYAVDVPSPGATTSEAARVLGTYVRDVMRTNTDNFRMFGPDETASNRLGAVLEVTDRTWMAEIVEGDDHLAPDGRVMEVLSEHQCQGWLEGYLLTGRHGIFNCYEAFIHIVDSMFNQHAKWLKVTRDMPWRRPIASLNYLLSSPRLAAGPQRLLPPGSGLHRPRGQQEVGRHPRLPAARREHAAVRGRPLPPQPPLRQRHRGRQAAEPELADDGRGDPPLHARDRDLGLGEQRRRRRARRRHGLRRRHPDARGARGGGPAAPAPAGPQGPVRQRRRPDAAPGRRREHPHGLSDREFDALFTRDKPIVFAYHGYPWLIHRLTYRRTNHANMHVRGYKEEGTTTTPFDMVMLNDLDRYHLAIDVIDRVPGLASKAGHVRQLLVDKRIQARAYTRLEGEDAPEIANWSWPKSEA